MDAPFAWALRWILRTVVTNFASGLRLSRINVGKHFFEVLVDVDGIRRKAWLFLMRLMYSGRDFAWIYERQDQISFLDGHVRAFAHFAGVPSRVAYDNLRAAVDRRLPDGRTLQPGQAITQQDAVRAYTVAAASSLGAPAGGLAAGEPADFVVCDGDPFAPGTRVTQTWIAGEQAWPATAGGQPS